MTKTRWTLVAAVAAVALSAGGAAQAHYTGRVPAGIAALAATETAGPRVTAVKAHKKAAKHATVHRKHKRARKHKAV